MNIELKDGATAGARYVRENLMNQGSDADYRQELLMKERLKKAKEKAEEEQRIREASFEEETRRLVKERITTGSERIRKYRGGGAITKKDVDFFESIQKGERDSSRFPEYIQPKPKEDDFPSLEDSKTELADIKRKLRIGGESYAPFGNVPSKEPFFTLYEPETPPENEITPVTVGKDDFPPMNLNEISKDHLTKPGKRKPGKRKKSSWFKRIGTYALVGGLTLLATRINYKSDKIPPVGFWKDLIQGYKIEAPQVPGLSRDHYIDEIYADEKPRVTGKRLEEKVAIPSPKLTVDGEEDFFEGIEKEIWKESIDKLLMGDAETDAPVSKDVELSKPTDDEIDALLHKGEKPKEKNVFNLKGGDGLARLWSRYVDFKLEDKLFRWENWKKRDGEEWKEYLTKNLSNLEVDWRVKFGRKLRGVIDFHRNAGSFNYKGKFEGSYGRENEGFGRTSMSYTDIRNKSVNTIATEIPIGIFRTQDEIDDHTTGWGVTHENGWFDLMVDKMKREENHVITSTISSEEEYGVGKEKVGLEKGVLEIGATVRPTKWSELKLNAIENSLGSGNEIIKDVNAFSGLRAGPLNALGGYVNEDNKINYNVLLGGKIIGSFSAGVSYDNDKNTKLTFGTQDWWNFEMAGREEIFVNNLRYVPRFSPQVPWINRRLKDITMQKDWISGIVNLNRNSEGEFDYDYSVGLKCNPFGWSSIGASYDSDNNISGFLKLWNIYIGAKSHGKRVDELKNLFYFGGISFN